MSAENRREATGKHTSNAEQREGLTKKFRKIAGSVSEGAAYATPSVTVNFKNNKTDAA